ncbi:MAG: PTS sugar transporter subunit IIA [Candidatus Cloacimonetes bacterium]|nr:PTS sugar transporter subunit IIA [Candidatus Cloacimonadota bacterium]
MLEANSMMTISEVAQYLKVTDKVVNELVNSGVLKKVGVGKNARIEKAGVDSWLASLDHKEAEDLAMRRVVCHFQDYFKVENIVLDFTADNKYEAIATISKKARDLKIVKDHRWLYEVVIAREDLVSTAVGNGVALLHPRHMHPTKIKVPTILFGRSTEPIEFDAIDDQPVNLFFMLLLHNDKQHLFSLSFLSKFLMSAENKNLLTHAKTPEAVYKALSGYHTMLRNADEAEDKK